MQDIKEISGKLWNAANELRGTMDASNYKDYILGFLFYRFLSEQQERYLVESGNIVPEEGKTINELYAEAATGEDLVEYLKDIFNMLGYAIRPEDTWASLMQKIENDEYIPEDFANMFDHFEDNLHVSDGEEGITARADLQGIFRNVDISSSGLGGTVNERARALAGVARIIDQISYVDEDHHEDVLGNVYMYLIEMFSASAGKKGGEFFSPVQPSKIIARIVTDGLEDDGTTFSVYDPTCGSAGLLLQVSHYVPGSEQAGRIQYYGQELNISTYDMAKMNLLMHGVRYDDMHLRAGNSLEEDWPEGKVNGIDHPLFFSSVVMNPPYSQAWSNDSRKLKDPRFSDYKKLAPKSKADYAFLLHGLYHLNPKGKMGIILPHGVLFRGAAEGEIRKVLLENNYIESVIGLPANLFFGTTIPVCIIILSKNKKDDGVLFIDASKEFVKGKNQNVLSDEHVDKIVQTWKDRKDVEKYAHLASLEEIRSNDYNLNIPRYVDTSEAEEEIDLVKVNEELKKVNAQIAEKEAWLNEQFELLNLPIRL